MATTITRLISLEEYMRTSYEYDAEYVEGRIVERPMPTPAHGLMQIFIGVLLYAIARPLGFEVMSELRIRTREDRCRIPDVCVTRGIPAETLPSSPPYLCIEILSPDDSAMELLTKIEEYLAMGVEYVWVINPVSLTGEICTRTGREWVTDGIFRAGEIVVDVRGVPR